MTTEIIIKKRLSPLAEKALELTISTDGDMKKAVEVLSKLNQINDRIAQEREKVTKPLNEALKAERARWRPIELQNEQAIETIRSKMSQYQTKLVRAKKEAEQKIAQRVSKGTLKIETAIKKIEGIEVVEKNVSTDTGSVNFRTVKKFEIINLSLVPIDYHLPNESLITKKMKEGEELPGIRYYTEEVPANFR